MSSGATFGFDSTAVLLAALQQMTEDQIMAAAQASPDFAAFVNSARNLFNNGETGAVADIGSVVVARVDGKTVPSPTGP